LNGNIFRPECLYFTPFSEIHTRNKKNLSDVRQKKRKYFDFKKCGCNFIEQLHPKGNYFRPEQLQKIELCR
jgi:hypothetical protein